MIIGDKRHIAHFDLDTFFVSVECLKNKAFVGKPLLVGGTGDRSVVAACSYEARKFGVHSAMPMKLAKRLCPQAIIISGDYDSYSKYSRLVTDVIADSVPLYEKASIDEFYIDMTGMDKFFGCSLFSKELKSKIYKESGLPISYGLAGNKLVSKVATDEAKPNGKIEVPNGEEKSYLAPLSINKIPGVGKETSALLMDMGVETVSTLSEIPMELLQNLLGKNGIDLWRKANGIDTTPVVPFREQKSISKENTFQEDTIDTEFLLSHLTRMVEDIAFDLRDKGKLTGCVSVKIRYSNFDTVTRQKVIAYTSADHLLLKTAKELLHKLYDRRLLIRLIGVKFTDLVSGRYQINLFDDKQEMIKLYQAIDSIKHRFGSHLVHSGRAV